MNLPVEFALVTKSLVFLLVTCLGLPQIPLQYYTAVGIYSGSILLSAFPHALTPVGLSVGLNGALLCAEVRVGLGYL